ncbi:MAG: pilus assembly protein TadG-related protein [Dehalococcoidia bacterium]
MRLLRKLRCWRQERGQVVIIMAVTATALVGLIGLVVDGGHFYAQRRQAQNAADAAALAGAFRLYEGESAAVATSAAFDYAQQNGYGGEDVVTVNIPPLSGEHVGDPVYVEAIVEEEPDSFFIHVVLTASKKVKGRAVAGTVPIPKDYAILVLDHDDCDAFLQGGSGDLYVAGGGIMVNSDCPDMAFHKEGTASQIVVDGDIDVHGGCTISDPDLVTPDPNCSVPFTTPDPFADLVPPFDAANPPNPPPAPAPDSPGTPDDPETWLITETRTIQPGVYYGGLLLEGGGTVTLQPGIYVMAGGGFTKKGNIVVQGDGVLIYATYNPYEPTGDGEGKPFLLEGTGTIELTAHTSGPYQDILFWQDEAITDTFRHAGNAEASVGIIYVPGATLEVAGGARIGSTQIIARDFYKTGSSDATITYHNFVDLTGPLVFLVE